MQFDQESCREYIFSVANEYESEIKLAHISKHWHVGLWKWRVVVLPRPFMFWNSDFFFFFLLSQLTPVCKWMLLLLSLSLRMWVPKKERERTEMFLHKMQMCYQVPGFFVVAFFKLIEMLASPHDQSFLTKKKGYLPKRNYHFPFLQRHFDQLIFGTKWGVTDGAIVFNSKPQEGRLWIFPGAPSFPPPRGEESTTPPFSVWFVPNFYYAPFEISW